MKLNEIRFQNCLWSHCALEEQLVWLGLILAISFHMGDEDDLHATMVFQVER